MVAASTRLGLEVRDLSHAWGRDAMRVSCGSRSVLILDGRVFPELSAQTDWICHHKDVTRQVLEPLGIPFPRSISFRDAQAEADRIQGWLHASGGPFVCKPTSGTNGHAVGMELHDFSAIVAHWRPHRSTYETFLVEQQVAGEDLRLQAIGGHLRAACSRAPAYVVGDGSHTIEALVTRRRAIVEAQNPENRLIIDEKCEALLATQGLARDSVAAADRKVYLQRVANMALGARATDVTKTVHRDYFAWIERCSEVLKLRNFAVDILTTDPAAKPAIHSHILEVNARAEWLHHTFSDGDTHDIPAMLLTDLLGLTHDPH